MSLDISGMSPLTTTILGVVSMLFVMFVFICIWASHYVKIGPNRVLIVSGRARLLADGTRVGFRIVKGGGTFVFPIYERADVLSLEVLSVEMDRSKVRTTNGAATLDCLAQVKVKGDDASIVAAMEHFLSKTQAEMKELVRPILEKHLSAVLGRSNLQQIEEDPSKHAASIEAAAAADLDKMGLILISFSIQNVRAA